MTDAVSPRASQPAATVLSVTIPAGQSLSPAVACTPGGTLTRIYMPQGWDGGMLSFQLSPDNVNFYDVFNADNSELCYNITPKTMVYIQPYIQSGAIILSSNNWLKLRSGSRNGPRIQSADRLFQLSLI